MSVSKSSDKEENEKDKKIIADLLYSGGKEDKRERIRLNALIPVTTTIKSRAKKKRLADKTYFSHDKQLKKRGEGFKFLRKLKGYSLQDLSDRSGFSVSYLNRLENGLIEPLAINVDYICDLLDGVMIVVPKQIL